MTRTALTALVLVLGLLLFSAIRPVWTIDPDASLYVSLARSVASGEGFTLDGVPHTKYPPGLPLALSLVVRLAGPTAYGAFHAVLVTALLGSVVLAFFVARRLGYPPPVAWAVAAATGLSQTLFDLSVEYIRTEALFLALSLAALLMLWRALGPRAGRASVLLAGLLIVGAMSVRLAGFGLLAVPMLHLIRRRAAAGTRGRAALILLMGLAGIAAWQWRAVEVSHAYPQATDYGAEFRAAEPRDLSKIVRVDMPLLDARSLAHRIAGNAEVATRAMAVLLTNVDRAGARLPVGLLLLGLVLLGLHVMWWRPEGHDERADAVAYVVAMLALCLVWPFNQQERFYVPLLPLLLISAGEGLREVARLGGLLASTRGGRIALLAAGAAVLLLLAAQRSDHPVLLGRWSASYAGLLAAGLGLWFLAWRVLSRGGLPVPRPALALLAPLLLLPPFLHRRCVEWPRQKAAFEARRAEHPQDGALAQIDVDERLEQVAIYLRDRTDPDTVVMTDVPRMMQIMSGRRCIPFVYRVSPPDVLADGAGLVFYTREIPEASAVMDAVASRFDTVFELAPVDDGTTTVTPAVYRPR